jgi:hypothetical protein
VTFETALNLLWCAIGVVALLGLYLSERRKGSGSSIGRRRRTLAVLLTTVSLFPCVSATDDEFCFSLLQTRSGTHGGVGAPLPEDSRDQAHQSLGRILETLGHYEVSSTYCLAVIFWFIGLVLLATKPTSVRELLLRAGRSPPLSSLA